MKRLIFISLFLISCNDQDKLGDCFIRVNQKVFGPYLTNIKGCVELENEFKIQIKDYSSCKMYELKTGHEFNLTDDVKVNTLNEKGWKVDEVLKIAKRKISKELSTFLNSNCN